MLFDVTMLPKIVRLADTVELPIDTPVFDMVTTPAKVAEVFTVSVFVVATFAAIVPPVTVTAVIVELLLIGLAASRFRVVPDMLAAPPTPDKYKVEMELAMIAPLCVTVPDVGIALAPPNGPPLSAVNMTVVAALASRFVWFNQPENVVPVPTWAMVLAEIATG